MALINCTECAKQVSDQALACPYCGHPIARKPPAARSINSLRLLVIFTMFCVLLVSAYVLFARFSKTHSHLADNNSAAVGSSDKEKTRGALQDFLVEAEKLDAIGQEIISESIEQKYLINDSKAYGSLPEDREKGQEIWSKLRDLHSRFDSQLRIVQTKFQYSPLPANPAFHRNLEDALRQWQWAMEFWGDTDMRFSALVSSKSAFSDAKKGLEPGHENDPPLGYPFPSKTALDDAIRR
jgi:hypothetical protein